VSDQLAELVCSNSLGTDRPDRAGGLLKAELRALGALLLKCADETRVPAGGALAVDRTRFAHAVTASIDRHPRIHVVREEFREIPTAPAVIATGPLTSDTMATAIASLTGRGHLYFYDAIAPIVGADSIDMSVAFRASRYGRGTDDYINCPLSELEYHHFVDALVAAERIPLHDFERDDARFFEGCLPVEVLAGRGRDALAYGPLRPVGLTDPRTGHRPYAAVQLRQDNQRASLYNMVGFQTNLRHREQERVFRLIPGLQHAEFMRHGHMHRNTFINAPLLLHPTLELRPVQGLFFAGQLTGIEGYVGSIASGWLAGLNVVRRARGATPIGLPETTMLGALCTYIAHTSPETFQPMKANFGLLPSLEGKRRGKKARYEAYPQRALRDLASFCRNHNLTFA
jgi:methylenetetrahydrofolate--tRNA-(uracil-5-)-methyltransferase